MSRRGGGAIKFFQENEGGAIKFEGNCLLINKSGIHSVVNDVATKSWSLM
jgi:hypothetical protein